MKKIILFLCIIIMCSVNAHAYTYKTPERDIPVDILVNGAYIKTDAAAFIENESTFVPIRFVSDALGADSIEWDPDTACATIKKGVDTIVLYENRNDAYVNGKKHILSGEAKTVGGRLFVPVRFVSESFGAQVGWDEKYYNVLITKEGQQVAEHMIDRSYTNDEVFWLARIIQAESSGEPSEGKVAVGNVVLNRVKSGKFPNTIYNVIFDMRFGVQFEPVINGRIYNNPSDESIICAKRALRGENLVGESLYFFNPRIASSNWISNNRRYYTTIKNHDFYL